MPKDAQSTCTGNINIDSKLNSINSYTITTTNANPQNFVFSADIYTVNHFLLCAPATGDRSVFKTEVGKKSYFTVPTLSNEQYILEIVPGISIPAADILTNTGTGVADSGISGTAADVDKAIHLAFVGAASGTQTDTIQFRAEVPFTGLTPMAPLKF